MDEFKQIDNRMKENEMKVQVLSQMSSIADENNNTYKKQVKFMKKFLNEE